MIALHALILFVLVSTTLVQIALWLLLFSKVGSYKPDAKNQEFPDRPISIIICAKNEEATIASSINSIIDQSYGDFELLVVDDNSTDDTSTIIKSLSAKYSKIRLLNIKDKPAHLVGKKYPLSKGIANSEHDWILLTDADCQPASNNWITKMTAHLAKGKKIVLGFSPYKTYPGLLNKFIRLESIYTAIQYFAFAIIKKPYMGVGRNLLYHKSLFSSSGGFASHMDIPSGDDDLFIRDAATSENVAICLDPDTFTYSEPEKSLKSLINQRTRHASTSIKYSNFHLISLLLLNGSHFLHYISILFIGLTEVSMLFALVCYLPRLFTLLIVYSPILKKFKAAQLLPWIPLLDLMIVLFYPVIAILLITRKSKKWN